MRRVAIAGILAMEPDMLVLDEPNQRPRPKRLKRNDGTVLMNFTKTIKKLSY